MSKRKTVRPGVREISPVSIYGEVYGGKNLRKRCVLSPGKLTKLCKSKFPTIEIQI